MMPQEYFHSLLGSIMDVPRRLTVCIAGEEDFWVSGLDLTIGLYSIIEMNFSQVVHALKHIQKGEVCAPLYPDL